MRSECNQQREGSRYDGQNRRAHEHLPIERLSERRCGIERGSSAIVAAARTMACYHCADALRPVYQPSPSFTPSSLSRSIGSVRAHGGSVHRSDCLTLLVAFPIAWVNHQGGAWQGERVAVRGVPDTIRVSETVSCSRLVDLRGVRGAPRPARQARPHRDAGKSSCITTQPY